MQLKSIPLSYLTDLAKERGLRVLQVFLLLAVLFSPSANVAVLQSSCKLEMGWLALLQQGSEALLNLDAQESDSSFQALSFKSAVQEY